MRGCKKIYEDNWLMVVDKPAGVLSVPLLSNSEISLLDILNKECRNGCVYPCHRLDRATSGLVIFAKDRKTQKEIMDLFRKRQIKKEYIAVIHGWLRNDSGEVKNYLGEGISPDAPRKLAITRFRVIKRNLEYSIVKVQPLTGRKNQIRIHFKQLGHPIVGERRFAFAKDYELKSRRLCLHASKLQFMHPRTKKNIRLFSPTPEDMNFF